MMDANFVRPEIGQWCMRGDKGESFKVVGRNENSRAIEVQSVDGELDEIDSEIRAALALERAEPPEDWTAPMDDVETDHLGYSETEMTAADWTQPLQTVQVEGESWEVTEP